MASGRLQLADVLRRVASVTFQSRLIRMLYGDQSCTDIGNTIKAGVVVACSNAQAGVGVGYHGSNSNACIDDIYSKGSHRTATWKFCRQKKRYGEVTEDLSWCTDRAQIDAQHAALKASLCSPSCIGPCDATQPVLGAANTYAPTYGAWGQRRLLSSQTNHSTSGEDHGHPGTAPPEDAAEAAALLNAHSDDLLALLADATHNVPGKADDPLLLMADATRADTKAEAKVAWDCG